MPRELTIDAEFKGQCPAHSEEELKLLREQIEEEGCIAPLVVWAGEGIILDGHTRYAMCLDLGIEFKVHEKQFAKREAAMAWILRHQLGRRNLLPEQRAVLLGNYYNLLKSSRGKRTGRGLTAELIAVEQGVSVPTILRHARYADAMQELKRRGSGDIVKAILDGDVRANVDALKLLSRRPKADLERASVLLKRGDLHDVADLLPDGGRRNKQVAGQGMAGGMLGVSFGAVETVLAKCARLVEELAHKMGGPSVRSRGIVGKLREVTGDVLAWKRSFR